MKCIEAWLLVKPHSCLKELAVLPLAIHSLERWTLRLLQFLEHAGSCLGWLQRKDKVENGSPPPLSLLSSCMYIINFVFFVVFIPSVIRNQMTFSQFTMLKMFLPALATSQHCFIKSSTCLVHSFYYYNFQ